MSLNRVKEIAESNKLLKKELHKWRDKIPLQRASYMPFEKDILKNDFEELKKDFEESVSKAPKKP